ncbi:unnamed protein product, partial [Urochloa humidicola]
MGQLWRGAPIKRVIRGPNRVIIEGKNLARVLENPKIKIIWDSEVVEAYGGEGGGPLAGVKVKNLVTGEVTDLQVAGLFFAIGHEPATKFHGGQLELDSDGYVATKPGSTHTSVKGVFAAGDVQDKKYRQAITAAGSGAPAWSGQGAPAQGRGGAGVRRPRCGDHQACGVHPG